MLEIFNQFVDGRKVVSMEPSRCIQAQTVVDDVIRTYPETVPIFIRYRLHCPGCLLAPFHTVADSAREYHRDLVLLLDDLNQAAFGTSFDRTE